MTKYQNTCYIMNACSLTISLDYGLLGNMFNYKTRLPNSDPLFKISSLAYMELFFPYNLEYLKSLT